ncbi:6-phosphogluconolactonase [Thiomicrorhabdus xiamenensis]|uniref:6-phosphogluconolactonase n=1 Tax=Thiomicrorhabdus xiamenensis TaxID=2739063 RepID=A0A7D4P2R1_9GAMM|nr:6-phosphogluconolactonase [Thiomicrorhabdus xiamenensis]QKI88096.1 6-phosphogluconolactonase [Thiomicrorhabdus xiamenensis]
MANTEIEFIQSPEQWQLYQEADELVEVATRYILDCAEKAIEARGAFNLVLAGGTTPLAIYERLLQFSEQQAQFSKWYLYLGDERVLPIDDPQRNSVAICTHWLDKSPIPPAQVFMMPTELGLEESARVYQDMIDGVEFDLVLLGMGEDGHTASLFPEHHLQEHKGLICEYDSPKPPSKRLSLSYSRLASAVCVLKLITGAAKYDVTQMWYQSLKMGRVPDLPIAKIFGRKETLVMLDQSAFSMGE